MDRLALQRKYKDIRNSLQDFSSKEFFIFLIFLAISATFWFTSTLNDTYEKEYPIRVEIIDVPKNIVITESLPDTIRVTIKDKGFNLLRYSFSDELKPIQIRFSSHINGNGTGTISQNDVQRLLKTRLTESSRITAIKADRWSFYYSYGSTKKVPVIIDGQLLPAPNYYVSRTVFTPDSVLVCASMRALDTINAVFTEPQNITNIDKSATYAVKLHPITGARIEPKRVKMSLIADQMTEVNLEVPVRPTNVPNGVSLKTFPARVNVRVAVGLRQSSALKPEQFIVVADYNDIAPDASEKMSIKIAKQPNGIVRASLNTYKVDYIIEK